MHMLYGLIVKELENIDKELDKYQETSEKHHPYVKFDASDENKYKLENCQRKFQERINYITNLSNQLSFGAITQKEFDERIENNYREKFGGHLYTQLKKGLSIEERILVSDNVGYYMDRTERLYFENGKFGYYYNDNSLWDWYVIGGSWDGEIIVNDEAECIEAIEPPAPDDEAFFKKHQLKGVNAAKLKDIDFELVTKLKQKDEAFIKSNEKFYNMDVKWRKEQAELLIAIGLITEGSEEHKKYIEVESFEDFLIDKSFMDIYGVILEDDFVYDQNNHSEKEVRDKLLECQKKYPDHYLVIVDMHC